MTKKILYRYLGTNGIIESPVHLEDIYYTRILVLTAEKNKMLTDGERIVKSVKVPEENEKLWSEIDPIGQD